MYRGERTDVSPVRGLLSSSCSGTISGDLGSPPALLPFAASFLELATLS